MPMNIQYVLWYATLDGADQIFENINELEGEETIEATLTCYSLPANDYLSLTPEIANLCNNARNLAVFLFDLKKRIGYIYKVKSKSTVESFTKNLLPFIVETCQSTYAKELSPHIFDISEMRDARGMHSSSITIKD